MNSEVGHEEVRNETSTVQKMLDVRHTISELVAALPARNIKDHLNEYEKEILVEVVEDCREIFRLVGIGDSSAVSSSQRSIPASAHSYGQSVEGLHRAISESMIGHPDGHIPGLEGSATYQGYARFDHHAKFPIRTTQQRRNPSDTWNSRFGVYNAEPKSGAKAARRQPKYMAPRQALVTMNRSMGGNINSPYPFYDGKPIHLTDFASNSEKPEWDVSVSERAGRGLYGFFNSEGKSGGTVMTRKEQLAVSNAAASRAAKQNAEARLKREYDERQAAEQRGRAEETRIKAQEEAAKQLQEEKTRQKKEETRRMREEFTAKQEEDEDFLSFLQN